MKKLEKGEVQSLASFFTGVRSIDRGSSSNCLGSAVENTVGQLFQSKSFEVI